MSDPHCLESVEFDVSRLVASHPPIWKHPLKQQVHDFIRANATPPVGALRCTRWEAAELPETLPSHRPTVDPPRGLYGNQFQQANWDAVHAALTILRPPTVTNLICIAAPTGSGRYTDQQIHDALETAYTGMKAAVLESRLKLPETPVEVHTGFWGGGAFGGNRPLMSLIQLLAAQLAGLERLVFYTGTQSEVMAFENGRSILRRILEKLDPNPSLSNIVGSVVDHHFSWGISDGN